MSTELWRMSALDLGRSIAAREVSSVEVVDAHLARIAAVNPHLNAVTIVLADAARAAARAADRALAEGGARGPLHGVPFTVKENIDVAGSATTHGVRLLAEAIPALDAPIVERMRAAGAIVLGRTNLPDLGLRVHTESSLRGLTRNPWHPGRTSGGSSGGEAAALAAGLTPLGLGNDIGGSLRNPAHCCGIASLKPTTGRLPIANTIPAPDGSLTQQLMHVDGPMARTVADLRATLAILAGPHPRDPFAVPAPLEGPRRAGPLRVAAMVEPPGGSTDPAIRAAVNRAAKALEDAGCAVEAAIPPLFERAVELWGLWLINDLRVVAALIEPLMGAEGATFLRAAEHAYPVLDVAGMHALFIERHTIAREWAGFLSEFDVLLSPVWTTPAFENGFDVANDQSATAVMETIRCVVPANLLGLPAAVVPAAVVDGLPLGVQLLGGRFREDLCLEAAAAIEAAIAPVTPIDPVLG